jgi:asparagine synthetase B (glutamine-hydrolysing)
MSADWPWPILNQWLPAFRNLALEAKRHGCRVVLSGEGGDEWLAIHPLYAADLLGNLDLAGLVSLTATHYRSFHWSPRKLLSRISWNYGARPWAARLARTVLRRLAPGRLRDRWRRQVLQERPAWIAPDPSLRRELDQHLEQALDRRLASREPAGFYVPSLRSIFDSVVRVMELEEAFEFGRRFGIRNLQPFWDAELVDFLFRTPPALLSRDGLVKGLVRRPVARRFPGLQLERQKKVLFYSCFTNMLQTEGPPLWKRMGGASALAELGIIDHPVLCSTMEAIGNGDRPRNLGLVLPVVNLEAWLRARL